MADAPSPRDFEAEICTEGYPLGIEITELPASLEAKILVAMAMRAVAGRLAEQAHTAMDAWYEALGSVVDTIEVEAFDEPGVMYPMFGEEPPDDLRQVVLSEQARTLEDCLFGLCEELETESEVDGIERHIEQTLDPLISRIISGLIATVEQVADDTEIRVARCL